MKRYTRRELIGTMASAAVPVAAANQDRRPNVVVILIDDQGYGDLGCMGNDKLHTPNIDRLCNEGVHFTNYYGCPLCSPARSRLLTGRYEYRTGIVDTSTGLAMMRSDETTMAQILSNAGYRTGIFGKWHLGDHYPLRPIDRGFHESLIAKDAIVAGIANAPNNSLFHPILYRNETPVHTAGYITDLTFDAAMNFMEASAGRPFFAYIPTNVVHEPLEVAPHYRDPFKAMGLDDYTATLYGEVVNLDENVGRLMAKLEHLGVAENTIILYSVDNGPTGSPRYNAGLRGGKGTVWEGGIKLPFFAHWPGRLPPAKKCRQIAAHIDVLPTVLELCDLKKPEGLRLDGMSLLPLMTGVSPEWPRRTLFFQQSRPDREHRVYGDEPRPFVDCAVRAEKYKIVMTADDPRERYFRPIGFEETRLYDLESDPGEKNDLAKQHPELVRRMRDEYDRWFRDVTRGVSPPVRNCLGSPHENPVKLSSQDLRGPRSALAPHMLSAALSQARKRDPLGFGYWAVEVVRDGRYRISMQFEPPQVLDDACHWSFPLRAGEAFLRIEDADISQAIPEGARSIVFEVNLRPGKYFLDASITGQREDGKEVSPFFVIVDRVGPLEDV